MPLTLDPCSHACPGSQKKDLGRVGRLEITSCLTSLGGESSNHRRKETGPTHRILLYFTAERRPTPQREGGKPSSMQGHAGTLAAWGQNESFSTRAKPDQHSFPWWGGGVTGSTPNTAVEGIPELLLTQNRREPLCSPPTPTER